MHASAFAVRLGLAAAALALALCAACARTALLPSGPAGSAAARATARAAAGLAAFPDAAPSVYWTRSLGPRYQGASGKLNGLLVDPARRATMYVAGGVGASDNVQTSAGVYKTIDAGKHWLPSDHGLADPTVDSLWMDPSQPGTLVATTWYGGIFRSTDGAGSWHQVYSGAPAQSLIDVKGTLYAAVGAGVVVSGNAGASWRLAYPTPHTAESVAVAGS
ncbi:MAG TPA: hypothetical protein VMH02_13455, partial [Verrucomicrobiae bacterium]|nr:hypothetical protein [Verrucomicrobiae bacterium]